MRRFIIKAAHTGIPALLVSALLALAALAGGCGDGGGSGAGGKLKVAASIQPLADFCRRVGGERVEVQLMVPAGASPHTYEPTASQMKFLSEARLLVVNGLELEAWASDILEKVGNRELVKVDTASRIPRKELIAAGEEDEKGGEGEEAEHEHGAFNPHVWLDPVLASFQVEAIRDALAEVDPEHAAEYRNNADAFLQELVELDAWVRAQLEGFQRKGFVAFHASWPYFARRYGLDMVGVVEELPGKEPSAADIASLLERMRAAGVTAVFAEPQFSPRAAQALAEASGGEVKVAVLDPLGSPDDPETATYTDLIRYDVARMGEALGTAR